MTGTSMEYAIQQLGLRCFGSREGFDRWLDSPCAWFDYRPPSSALEDPMKHEDLHKVLVSLSHKLDAYTEVTYEH